MSNYPYASMRDSFDLSAYFVVGPQDCKGRPITDVIDDALRGGASFIQLRVKDADAKDLTDMARDIAQIIEDNNKSDSVAFVIDDRVDVVWQARSKGIKVDGVHIGQTDMEPREARALLGEDAIVGLSAETESLVKLINELPDGCIDYIGAAPLHVSVTKPEASVGGNDGSGRTLDEEQINTICSASGFPVVVGGGVTADDMEMLAHSKAAGWFVVSAIAGADDPEAATRNMVARWKAVRGDTKHGYAPRVKAQKTAEINTDNTPPSLPSNSASTLPHAIPSSETKHIFAKPRRCISKTNSVPTICKCRTLKSNCLTLLASDRTHHSRITTPKVRNAIRRRVSLPYVWTGFLTVETSKNMKDVAAIWKMTANAPSNVARLPRNGVVRAPQHHHAGNALCGGARALQRGIGTQRTGRRACGHALQYQPSRS